MQINFHISPDVRENIRHSFPMLSLSLNLHNYPNIYLSILFLLLQFSMIVSIYFLYTVLWLIQTVFLLVLNMLFGLMTTRLNKCYYYYYNIYHQAIVQLLSWRRGNCQAFLEFKSLALEALPISQNCSCVLLLVSYKGSDVGVYFVLICCYHYCYPAHNVMITNKIK